MTNEECCVGKCCSDHYFEETENGFKLEVKTQDKKKAELLKNLIKAFKELHCYSPQ